MKTLIEMTNDEVQTLMVSVDARVREQEVLMANTPKDTVAYAAMAASRPNLLRFRRMIDRELNERGF